MKPEHFAVNPKEVAYAQYEYHSYETMTSNADHEQHKVFMYLKMGSIIDILFGSKQEALDFIDWLQDEWEL